MSSPGRPRDDRPRPHRLGEFPAGYSLGRCGGQDRGVPPSALAGWEISGGGQWDNAGARGTRGVPPPPMLFGPLLSTTFSAPKIVLMSLKKGVPLPSSM